MKANNIIIDNDDDVDDINLFQSLTKDTFSHPLLNMPQTTANDDDDDTVNMIMNAEKKNDDKNIERSCLETSSAMMYNTSLFLSSPPKFHVPINSSLPSSSSLSSSESSTTSYSCEQSDNDDYSCTSLEFWKRTIKSEETFHNNYHSNTRYDSTSSIVPVHARDVSNYNTIVMRHCQRKHNEKENIQKRLCPISILNHKLFFSSSSTNEYFQSARLGHSHFNLISQPQLQQSCNNSMNVVNATTTSTASVSSPTAATAAATPVRAAAAAAAAKSSDADYDDGPLIIVTAAWIKPGKEQMAELAGKLRLVTALQHPGNIWVEQGIDYMETIKSMSETERPHGSHVRIMQQTCWKSYNDFLSFFLSQQSMKWVKDNIQDLIVPETFQIGQYVHIFPSDYINKSNNTLLRDDGDDSSYCLIENGSPSYGDVDRASKRSMNRCPPTTKKKKSQTKWKNEDIGKGNYDVDIMENHLISGNSDSCLSQQIQVRDNKAYHSSTTNNSSRNNNNNVMYTANSLKQNPWLKPSINSSLDELESDDSDSITSSINSMQLFMPSEIISSRRQNIEHDLTHPSKNNKLNYSHCVVIRLYPDPNQLNEIEHVLYKAELTKYPYIKKSTCLRYESLKPYTNKNNNKTNKKKKQQQAQAQNNTSLLEYVIYAVYTKKYYFQQHLLSMGPYSLFGDQIKELSVQHPTIHEFQKNPIIF